MEDAGLANGVLASLERKSRLPVTIAAAMAELVAAGRLRAKFVPVTTGITGATDIEVLSGLNNGEEIVTGPYKTLRDLKGGALLKRDKSAPLTTATDSNHYN